MKDTRHLIESLSVLFLAGIIGLAGCGKKDDGEKITIKSPGGDDRIEKKAMIPLRCRMQREALRSAPIGESLRQS